MGKYLEILEEKIDWVVVELGIDCKGTNPDAVIRSLNNKYTPRGVEFRYEREEQSYITKKELTVVSTIIRGDIRKGERWIKSLDKKIFKGREPWEICSTRVTLVK